MNNGERNMTKFEELSDTELDRFSRQIMLEEIGYQGQLKLKNAKVCVVGTGGLGNPITTRLVAMGIGTLRIVDRDVIELSNLHRQTMFDEDDVGKVKVEVAGWKLKKLNPDCDIKSLSISVNDYTALEVIEGCDVVVDALDNVNARYALNKACVKLKIPFVTGAAVGVSGQIFTILPGTSACYHCMFPALDEDTMPTCGTEGVHPSILEVVGGIEVAEVVKIILGKKPNLSDKMLHINIENLDFTSTQTFRAEECPVCGTGILKESVKEEFITEELCSRNHGKRTFSITPTSTRILDEMMVLGIAKDNGFHNTKQLKQNYAQLVSKRDDISISFMTNGSAIVVGCKDEKSAISLYNKLIWYSNDDDGITEFDEVLKRLDDEISLLDAECRELK